jgi:hypothetical protein
MHALLCRRVRERHNTYNNDETVSQSWLKSAAKLAYYHLFALLYGAVGAFASVRPMPLPARPVLACHA